MLPDRTEELHRELADALGAMRRIAKAIEVDRLIPMTPAGFVELAETVEKVVRGAGAFDRGRNEGLELAAQIVEGCTLGLSDAETAMLMGPTGREIAYMIRSQRKAQAAIEAEAQPDPPTEAAS